MKKDQAVPEWLLSKTGVTDRVPAPWTPVTFTRDAASCWGRTYAFEGAPLPSRILSRGENLLARPMQVCLRAGGRTTAWTGGLVAEVECHPYGRYVRRDIVGRVGDFLLTSRSTVWYDGAVKVDVTLKPLRATNLESLTLVLPMRRAQATTILADLGPGTPPSFLWAADEIPDGGRTGPLDMPVLWFGNEERGLTWFRESDEGWDPGDGVLALHRDAKTVTAEVRMIRSTTRSRSVSGIIRGGARCS